MEAKQQITNHHYYKVIQDLIEGIHDPSSKLRYTYTKALNALKAYPLLLKSGAVAKKELKGVGEKIANILNNLKCKGDGSPWDAGEEEGDARPKDQGPDPGASRRLTPRKRSAPKKYIPTARSGGYAILLALLRHSGITGFLSKHDIQRHGQQYCNSSFTMPKAGATLHYSAWNSINKLVSEDLVLETGNPKRYSLTDEGEELAKKIAIAHDKKKSGNEENRKAVLLDSHCTSDMLESEDFDQPPLDMNFNQGSFSGYGTSSSQLHPTAPSLIKSRPWQALESRLFTNVPPAPSKPLPPVKSKGLPVTDTVPRQTISTKPPKITFENSFYSLLAQEKQEKEEEALQAYSGTFRKVPIGVFEILLALDNREVRSRRDRDFFQLELEKRGVKVITLPLTLGDVCWVARSVYDHEDLIILDYIVERKAKEDLIASIQDGRFKEQKHRLSKCGISNVIYLVEEYDPFSRIGDSLATALTETQILHGFFVKQCANVAETVEYLVNLTRAVTRQVLNSPLCVLNASDIRSESFAALKSALLKKHNRPFYIPLSDFSTLNTKTKQLTSQDIWAKQLLTIRGVSTEKAVVLAKHFTCMGDLVAKLIMSCSDPCHQRRQFGKALAKNIISSLFGE